MFSTLRIRYFFSLGEIMIAVKPNTEDRKSEIHPLVILVIFVLLFAAIWFVLDKKTTYHDPITEAVESIGLVRTADTSGSEIIATVDGVCAIRASYSKDPASGEIIIHAKQDGIEKIILSEQDLMFFCK
jgi:hypothetical protein